MTAENRLPVNPGPATRIVDGSPSQFRLAKKHDGSLVMQGGYKWSSETEVGIEWKEIPTHDIASEECKLTNTEGMSVLQEPKYGIHVDVLGEGVLYNRHSGQPIPFDEPVFIFRAKDRNAAAALRYYQSLCFDVAHKEAIQERIDQFEEFAQEHLNRMKYPDTQKGPKNNE